MSDTIAACVSRVSEGGLRPSELVRASLAAAQRLQPQLNAFIRIEAEEATETALALDARAPRGDPALHGVSIAYKDMFDRPGRRCTYGARFGQQEPATTTATPLRRLEACGAVMIGPLNMSEYALGPTGHNATFGACRNPHDPSRIAGGSSSGAAAAVAAGIVQGAIGSDTGGSIRIPAACCGVVGLKPTYGAVSRHGAMPLSFSLDCVGPIARTVADCATLFDCMRGRDPRDPTCVASAQPVAQRAADPRRFRLQYPAARVAASSDAEVANAIDEAVARLAEAGAEVADTDLSEINTLHMLADVIQKAESSAAHLAPLSRARATYSQHVRRRIESGFLVSASAYVQALSQRGPRLAAFLDGVLGDADALVIPTLAVPTPMIAETDEEQLGGVPDLVARMTAWTRWVNYLGLPALSLPVGGDRNGMPIGLQLVGRPGSETRLFEIAAVIEVQAGALPIPAILARQLS